MNATLGEAEFASDDLAVLEESPSFEDLAHDIQERDRLQLSPSSSSLSSSALSSCPSSPLSPVGSIASMSVDGSTASFKRQKKLEVVRTDPSTRPGNCHIVFVCFACTKFSVFRIIGDILSVPEKNPEMKGRAVFFSVQGNIASSYL